MFFQHSHSGVLEETITGPGIGTAGLLLPIMLSYKFQLWDIK